MEVVEIQWKKEIVDCIHFLHQKGFAPATSSNYSYKESDGSDFYISTSGIDKGAFTEAHFMRVDLLGNPIDDKRKPSAETLLHALIYSKKQEMGCVLHTHTVYNTVLSSIFAADKHLKLEGFEVLKGIRGVQTHEESVEIPIFENSQDMPALANQIEDYWNVHPGMTGFLLAGHGLYTWGTSIAEAKRHIEVFEFLFEVVYKIKTFTKG